MALIAAAGAIAVLVSGGSDDDAAPVVTPASTTTTIGDGGETTPISPPGPDATTPSTTASSEPAATTEVPETTEAPTMTAAPSSDEIAGAPAGLSGDRDEPVPAGSIGDVGDGWRLQVLDVDDDATDAVMAENQFNDPPPEGSRFTLVTVALGYFGLDDPQSGLFTTISGVASANTELDADCGVIPNELDSFVDMFGGAVQTGTVCFVTTPADTGQLQLYATAGFSGADVFLDAAAAPTSVEPMASITGAQPDAAATEQRQSPIALGSRTELGDGWSMTVTDSAVDITDQVLGANQFNDPPPDGDRFVGVGVELAYDGDGADSALAVNIKAVGDSNIELSQNCGAFDDEIERFDDIFAGGATAGLMCFVAPASDLGTIVLYGTASFDDDDRYFAVD